MPTEGPQTRRHILDAAQELMRHEGMGGATTRAIAQRAGCAEGTIYRHFPDKQALIVEIVQGCFPEFLHLMDSLPSRAGAGTVRQTLEEVGAAALAFYRGIIPLVVGPLTDPKLVLEQRRYFEATKTGPLRVFEDLTTYLRRERDLGRVSVHISPEHVTRILLGTFFGQAFVEALLGDDARLGLDEAFVATAVGSVLTGLEPRPA